MSDATLTVFDHFYAADSVTDRDELAALIELAVARHAHHKSADELKPGEVTTKIRDAGRGSRSSYRSELRLTMDYADYPFEREDFNTPVAHDACTRLAKAIWRELRSHLREAFLVWVIAGHMTGYFDNDFSA